MRRKASMSGSTSTKSSSKPRVLTSPLFSASLLPWVRATVFSLSAAMSSFRGAAGSAALARDVARERVLHPRRRQVLAADFLDGLEDLEMVALAIGSPERHERLERRKAGQGACRFLQDDGLLFAEREALAGPILHALDGFDVRRSPAVGREPRAGAARVRPAAYGGR